MTKQLLSEEPKTTATPYYNDIQANDEIDLRELFSELWKGKWIILLTTIIFAASSVLYALKLPNIYRSDVLLTPSESTGQGGLYRMSAQFDSLASLAGINLGGNEGSQTQLAVQVMKSRHFIDAFIKKHNLLVPLMASNGWDLPTNKLIYNEGIYDQANHKWLRKPTGLRGRTPSSQEVYNKFSGLLNINESKGLYTISISFYSPYLAQQWVTWLVDDINQAMRERTITESTQNLNYLKEQLSKTSVADMQNTFYKLIEEQTKSLMLAKVQDEFVFKVVDPAVAPELKAKPKRALIVISGTFLGGILGILIVLARLVFRNKK